MKYSKYTRLNKYPRRFVRDKIIFIHIPKCAGSSILDSLLGFQIGHATAEYFHSMDPDIFNQSFVFSCVRNPIARFISAYNYLLNQTLWSGLSDIPQKLQGKGTLDDFASSLDFNSEFYSYPWFAPQHEFVEIDGQVAVDLIIKTEDLKAGLASVRSISGCNVNEPANLNASPQPSVDFSAVLSDRSIANIKKIYEKDFTLFGYY